MQEFLDSGTLNIIYAVAVLVSFVFALITLIGAEAGDVLDLDLDADADSGFDFVNVSPFALAMFGAIFGLVGLITHVWLEMGIVSSILWATGSGIAIGALAQGLFIYVLSPSRSSHFDLSVVAEGREAEVIITIPPDGRGTIAFDTVGGRVTLGARSGTGKKISRGETVVIGSVSGRIVVVQPLEKLAGDKSI